MKPYLTIKTVKGKKYIQIKDLHGNLIHIGPANKIETWTVAYQALKNAYEGLVLEELLDLKRTADEEGINLMTAIDEREHLRGSESWKAFRVKQKKKRHERFVLRMLIGGIGAEDPRLLGNINDLENEFLAYERTSEIVGVSPECVELTEKVFKLYETEPSPN